VWKNIEKLKTKGGPPMEINIKNLDSFSPAEVGYFLSVWIGGYLNTYEVDTDVLEKDIQNYICEDTLGIYHGVGGMIRLLGEVTTGEKKQNK
jgi:hypothetical protein